MNSQLRIIVCITLLSPLTLRGMNNNNAISFSGARTMNEEQPLLINVQQSQKKSDCNCTSCLAQGCCFPCLLQQQYNHEYEQRDAMHQKELALIKAATAAVSNSNNARSSMSSSASAGANNDHLLRKDHRECNGKRVCTWIVCWPFLTCCECTHICCGYINGSNELERALYKKSLNNALRELGYEENTESVAKTVKDNWKLYPNSRVWNIFPDAYRATNNK